MTAVVGWVGRAGRALLVLVASACGDPGTAPVDALVGTDVPCVATLAAVPMATSFGTVAGGTSSAPAELAITNVGTCATAPLAVTLVGTAAADFSIEGTTCTGRALAAAESCTATVRFTPTTTGPKIAAVRVEGADAPLEISIDGTGGTFCGWTLSPGARTFPATHVGVTSSPLDFTITSCAGIPSAGIPSVVAVGTDAGQFTITSNGCSAILPPGGSCVLSVAFRPTTTGDKGASFVISDPHLGTVTAGVSGTALTGLELSPSSHDFGATRITTTSLPQRFTLTNLTTVPSSSSLTASLVGSNTTHFAIVGDTCSSAVLPAGGTCDVDVVFQPAALGAQGAALRVTDATLGTIEAPLAGTGITGGGNITVSPTMIDFGSAASPGARATVTVTNNSGSPYGAMSTTLSGANAGSYLLASNTCSGSMLAPGTSCTVDVETSCTNAGQAQSAVLSLVATPGGAVTVPITGTVNASACSPFLPPSPPTASFADRVVGTTSAPTRFTVTNSGGQPTAALSNSIGGPSTNDFTITSSTCAGAVLAPGAQCTIDVAFTPQSAGVKNAGLLVFPGPSASTLSGTAIARTGDLTVFPTMIDFGPTAGSGVRATVTITNTSGSTYTSLTTTLGGTDPGSYLLVNDTCSGTMLAPNTSCTVDVETTCTRPAQQQSAELSVVATPGGSATIPITGTVNGKACFAFLVGNPSVAPFGDQVVGTTSASTTFNIVNYGGQPSAALAPAIGGADPTEFTITSSTCAGMVLVPGAGCTIDVAFAPQSTGMKTAVLQVSPNLALGLAGTGVATVTTPP